MYTYKLSYNEICSQDRTIISLVRVNKQTETIESIRASSVKITNSKDRAMYLNFYTGKNFKVLEENYATHCFYGEDMLGSRRVDSRFNDAFSA